MQRKRKVQSRKVADAAGQIFLSRENQNPYSLDYHTDDCDEPDLWLDDDTLIPEDQLDVEILSCPACAHLYGLWSRIIEMTGAADYGHRAFAALELDDYLENFRPDMSEIDADGWRDVKAVRAERARLEAQRQYNQQEEAKKQNVGR